MKQQKLEEKVRDLFERQGFEITVEGDRMRAKNDQELLLNVFSSNDYTVEEVQDSVSDGEKVFVDEGLEDVKLNIDNPVSVLHEEEESEEYELPSYEIIGEVAVINELNVDEEEAVEGILQHHPSVKTILVKETPLKGEYRVGDYRKLYGEETETVHTEYGCRFKVDPTKVYYSERFSTERKRVIDQIQDGEKVLVMFAGVGPFAIMAAKLANPDKVVAIEKNPVAAKYLKENIGLNDASDVVNAYEGDVAEVLPEIGEKFDRIIMPLPEKADEFLDLAEEHLMDNGVVHMYTFGTGSEDFESEDFDLVRKEKCGERGPEVDRYCLDLVRKK